MFALAEHLHMSVSDVLRMSQIEFKGWLAYLSLKAKRNKGADKRTNNIRRR